MATEPFAARSRNRSGVAVIDLAGQIDRTSEAALQAAYEEVLSTRPSRVLLNFDAVDYINSTGIAVIVGLLAQARKGHVTITACGLSDHYKEIFQITRLSDFMAIYDDEDNAVAEVPA
jgi:anti-anti-sigma factor